MNNIKKKDIITCGFALFAIFFGAGNLIFPPYLGALSGDRWYVSMFGFLLTDPALPVLGVLVTMKLGGRADNLGKRVSPKFAKLLGIIAILLIGPLFAVPRTGATTHEIFTQVLFGENIPVIVTSVVFFAITCWLAINPNKVMDYVGNILTPVLLIILSVIVAKSIISPPGQFIRTDSSALFSLGFKEGYQTMDALGAALMAGIVSTDLVRRGYTDEKIRAKVGIGVGLVALVLLALVYGGLTYAGANVGEFYTVDTPRTELLIGMTSLLLGDIGRVALGIAVALACLTTSVGLISTCGNYFSTISQGKLKYKMIVSVASFVSFVISLLGVESIINIAVPILTIIYPVVMVLIFFSIFDKWIKYNWTYMGAVVGAFSFSLLEGLDMFGKMAGINVFTGLGKLISLLPLAQDGFAWILPSLFGALLFTLFSKYTNIGGVGEKYKLLEE